MSALPVTTAGYIPEHHEHAYQLFYTTFDEASYIFHHCIHVSLFEIWATE